MSLDVVGGVSDGVVVVVVFTTLVVVSVASDRILVVVSLELIPHDERDNTITIEIAKTDIVFLFIFSSYMFNLITRSYYLFYHN